MTWVLLIAAAALGGLIQTVIGFGAGVVMMTVFPYLLSITLAPTLSTSVCLGVSVPLAWKFRRSINLRLAVWPALLYSLSSITAVRTLKHLDLTALTVALGVFLMGLSAYYLFYPTKRVRKKPTVLKMIVFSLVSGLCGGLFGIGGPLMAVYFLSATEDRQEYTGCIQLTLSFTSLLNFTMRAVSGYYTAAMVPMTLLGIAAINAGRWVGLKVGGRIEPDRLRRTIYVFVGLSGLLTAVRALL